MAWPRQIREIVSIRDWVNDEYYLGKEVDAIRPFWKEKLIQYYEECRSSFIFYGGKRTGKSWIPLFMVDRCLYEQSCFEDFPLMFGLSPTTVLKYYFLSISKQKAKNTGLNRLIKIVDNTPYWHDIRSRNRDITSYLDMGFAQVFVGSEVTHIIGEDTFGVLFDESDYVKSAAGEEYVKAKEIYAEAEQRIHLTYAMHGETFGLLGLMSSAGFETSFTEQEINIAKKNPKKIFLVEAAAYDVYDNKYSLNKFEVFIGVKDIRPHIIGDIPENCDRKESYMDDAGRQFIAQNFGMLYDQIIQINKDKIIKVPEDMRQYYERDLEGSIQGISGKAISSSGTLMKNYDLIKKIFDKTSLKNPLNVEIPLLTVGSDETVMDYVDEQTLMDNYESGQAVYIHVDSSKRNDKTGFAAVYRSSTGIFRVLLYMQVFRQSGDTEIDISKVLDTVFWMRDLGCYIKYVTYDMAGGGDMARQEISRRLGKDRQGYQSVDKTSAQYLLLNLMIKKGFLDIYEYKPFVKEYQNLIYDRAFDKVDHPAEFADGSGPGSKDVADSLVGALNNAYSFEGMGEEDMAFERNDTTAEPDIDDDKFYDGNFEDTDRFYSDLSEKEIDKTVITESDIGDDPAEKMRKRLLK